MLQLSETATIWTYFFQKFAIARHVAQLFFGVDEIR